jgi:integrase
MGARSRPVHFKFEKVHLLAVAGGERSRVVDDRGEPLELARPAKGEVVWFDTKQPGLAVRVPATGTVRFMLYTWIGGKPIKRNLAPVVVDGWSVDRARLEAVKRKAAVEEGREGQEDGKPAAEPEPAPAPTGPTLGSAFAKFIRVQKTENRTWREDVRRFRKHLREYAKRPLGEVNAEWLSALHGRITKGGHPGAANRLLSMVSDMLHVGQNLPKTAPTAASFVARNPEEARLRRLTKDEEDRLLPAIDEYEAEPIRVSGNEGTDPAQWPEYRKPKSAAKLETFRNRWRENLARKRERARRNRRTEADILRLLYWSGQRAGEVRSMEWSEVDFADRLWTIPAGKYKTEQPHICTLPEEAVAILKRRKAEAEPGARFVFPAGNSKSKRGHYVNYFDAWARVKELAGIDAGTLEPEDRLRVHDLRGAFATAMAADGANFKDIQESLGHRNPKTTLRYIRRDVRDRAAAVDRMAAKRRERLGLVVEEGVA